MITSNVTDNIWTHHHLCHFKMLMSVQMMIKLFTFIYYRAHHQHHRSTNMTLLIPAPDEHTTEGHVDTLMFYQKSMTRWKTLYTLHTQAWALYNKDYNWVNEWKSFTSNCRLFQTFQGRGRSRMCPEQEDSQSMYDSIYPLSADVRTLHTVLSSFLIRFL